MESTQKTYQALANVVFDTYIVVKGSKFLVQFRGGMLEPRTNGIFVTNNKDIIAAMEKDSGFNKTFKLKSSETILTDDPVKHGASGSLDRSDWQKVEGTTSVQKAKDWLLEASEEGRIRKGITTSLIPNKTTVLALADEFKIVFVDLPE